LSRHIKESILRSNRDSSQIYTFKLKNLVIKRARVRVRARARIES